MGHGDGTPGIAQGAKPFLRWAGGKQLLAGKIAAWLPPDVTRRTYHEPFFGAGSLFFRLCPKRAVLSDLNGHLMNCYSQIRDHPGEIARRLTDHGARNCRDYYYEQRDAYNADPEQSPEQAARFIYLNRTCFNGIFRVNRRGRFNVPYGRKDHPLLPSESELDAVRRALSSAELRVSDFRDSMTTVRRGDFVYLDPPYPPLNGTAYFTHYTVDRFGDSDQEALADAVRVIDQMGCRFLMSNADVPLVRDLYARFNITELSVTRYITCSKKRHRVSELLITNYLPGGSGSD